MSRPPAGIHITATPTNSTNTMPICRMCTSAKVVSQSTKTHHAIRYGCARARVSASMREVVEQLQDVGEAAHRGDIGASARPLHHERRARVPLRRKCYDVVAAFRVRERMVARELLDPGARPIALEHTDVAQDGAASGRALPPALHP